MMKEEQDVKKPKTTKILSGTQVESSSREKPMTKLYSFIDQMDDNYEKPLVNNINQRIFN